MDRVTHAALLRKLSLPLSAWPHFQAIAAAFGVSFDTVFSIYSLEVQGRVLRTNHVVKAGMAAHAQRWLAGVDAVQLAFELDFPPCVLLRRLLEHLQLGLPRERLTRALRHPDQLPALVSPEALAQLAAAAAAAQAASCSDGRTDAAPAAAAAAAGSGDAAAGSSCGAAGSAPTAGAAGAAAAGAADADPAQRLLARLQRDIEDCVLCDRVYSPASDAMRHSAGLEYEARLEAGLAQAGVAFWTEGQLRSKGYHKTPDARLQVPIAVQGRIVSWIDSKATFGDDKLHRQQAAEQYERYVNRFGPGLVIYWHGFLADLNRDDNVLLMDRFPTADEILQLPCLLLNLAAPAPPAQQAGATSAGGDAATSAAGQLAAVSAAAAAAMAAPPAEAAAAAAAAAQLAGAAPAAVAEQCTPVRQRQTLAGLGSSPAATPVRC